MTVWPTIAATALGRLVGRLCGASLGRGFFTLGKLLALATIPASLTVFLWQLLPLVCRRYTLTNRRIMVQKGYKAIEGRAIGLDEFDFHRRAAPARPGLAARRRVGVSAHGARSSASRGFPAPRSSGRSAARRRTAMLSFRGGADRTGRGVPRRSRRRWTSSGCRYSLVHGRNWRARMQLSIPSVVYSTGGSRRTPLPRSSGSAAGAASTATAAWATGTRERPSRPATAGRRCGPARPRRAGPGHAGRSGRCRGRLVISALAEIARRRGEPSRPASRTSPAAAAGMTSRTICDTPG